LFSQNKTAMLFPFGQKNCIKKHNAGCHSERSE